MNPVRIIAIVYAVLFAGVTSLNYIPGLTDAEGRTFGLFALDIFDDALHAASVRPSSTSGGSAPSTASTGCSVWPPAPVSSTWASSCTACSTCPS